MAKLLRRERPSFISHDPVGGWKKAGQRCEGRITQNIMTSFSHLSRARLSSAFERWTGANIGVFVDVCVCLWVCAHIRETEREKKSFDYGECVWDSSKEGDCVGGMWVATSRESSAGPFFPDESLTHTQAATHTDTQKKTFNFSSSTNKTAPPWKQQTPLSFWLFCVHWCVRRGSHGAVHVYAWLLHFFAPAFKVKNTHPLLLRFFCMETYASLRSVLLPPKSLLAVDLYSCATLPV